MTTKAEGLERIRSLKLRDAIDYCCSLGIDTDNFDSKGEILAYLEQLPPPPDFGMRLTNQVDQFQRVSLQQLDALTQLKNAVHKIPREESTRLAMQHIDGTKNIPSISSIEKKLEDPNAYLVVVGDVSSGKSLFLNSLFREEVLPSAASKTTSAVCKIQFHEHQGLFAEEDGQLREILSFDGKNTPEINMMLKKEKLKPEIRYMLQWNSPLLKSGLSFVDTPGFNDAELKTNAVLEFLNDATGFIILVNAISGISETIGKMLLSMKAQNIDPKFIFFIVTHLDTMSKSEQDDALTTIFNELAVHLPGWVPENFSTINMRLAANAAFSRFHVPIDYQNLISKLTDFLESSLFNKASLIQLQIRQKASIFGTLIASNLNSARTDAQTKVEQHNLILQTQESFDRHKEEIKKNGNIVLNQEIKNLKPRLAKIIETYLKNEKGRMRDHLKKFQLNFSGSEDAKHYFVQYMGLLVNLLQEQVAQELRPLHLNMLQRVVNAMRDQWEKAEENLQLARHLLTASPQNSNLDVKQPEVVMDFEQPSERAGHAVMGIGGAAAVGGGAYLASLTTGWWMLGAFAVGLYGGFFIAGGLGLLAMYGVKFADYDWKAKEIYLNEEKREAFIMHVITEFLSEMSARKLTDDLLKSASLSGDNVLQAALQHLETSAIEVSQLATLSRQIRQNKETASNYEDLQNRVLRVMDATNRLELYSNSKWTIKPQHLTIDESCVLGSSPKGDVHRGELKHEGQTIPVAVKAMPSSTLQEAEVLCSLNHTNVVKFYGVCFREKTYLIYELCDYSLAALLRKPVSNAHKVSLGMDVAKGMLYLHSMRYVHRDLTPGNILVSGGAEQIAKIGDFGQAKSVCLTTSTPDVTTPVYAAPEAQHTAASDIYSFGLVLWQIWHAEKSIESAWAVTWSRLFPAEPTAFVSIAMLKILHEQKQLPDINESIPKNIASLIRSCCHFQPDQRPWWETVLLALNDESWKPQSENAIAVTRKMRPLRVLSMDGGGTAAVVILTVLETLLEMASAKLQRAVLVRDLFDVIGGTSTGGIVAIGMGLHQMSLQDALNMYLHHSAEVFPSSYNRLLRLVSAKPMFDEKPLESLLALHLGRVALTDCPSLPRVFAVARKDCIAGPFLFRNYHSTHRLAAPGSHEATTYDAARATSGPPMVLKRFKLDGHVYSDGGFGFNNPSSLAADEVVALALEAGDSALGSIACLLSIGCGTTVVGDAPPNHSVWNLARRTLTDTEQTHKAMKIRAAQANFNYQRLNPVLSKDFDLWESDPQQLQVMIASTREYLQTPNVKSQLEEILLFLLQPLSKDVVTIHM